MDFISKCKVAGIGDGSVMEGYPVVNGKVLRKINGVLKAYTKREDPKPWEDVYTEDEAFPQGTLDIVEAIEADDLESLPTEAQAAIADVVEEETEASIVVNRKFLRIVNKFWLKAMKYYYNNDPAYLSEWHSLVDKLYPESKPWD